jgi:hypothetical protein
MEACQFLLQAKKAIIDLLLGYVITRIWSPSHMPASYWLTRQIFVLLQDQNSLPQPTELDIFLPKDGSDLSDGINSGK